MIEDALVSIASAISLAAAAVGITLWLKKRETAENARFAQLELGIALLEQQLAQLKQQLAQLEDRPAASSILPKVTP